MTTLRPSVRIVLETRLSRVLAHPPIALRRIIMYDNGVQQP